MRIVIAGGTGKIGSRLCDVLRGDGHEVSVLTRQQDGGPGTITWDPVAGVLDPATLAGTDAVLCVTGASIARRWNEAGKKRLWEGGIPPVRLLATTMAKTTDGPKSLIYTTSAGYFGVERGSEPLTEESPSGEGYYASLVREWEAAAEPARQAGIRVAVLRPGQIVGPGEGVLSATLGPFKAGLGLTFSGGRNHVSWVSAGDVVRAIKFILEHQECEGIYNCAAPHPVTHREFVRAIGERLGKRRMVSLPGALPGLFLGDEARQAVITPDSVVVPARLLKAGFEFHHGRIDLAVAEYVPRPKRATGKE